MRHTNLSSKVASLLCITALCTIFSAVSSKAYAQYGILVNGTDVYEASYTSSFEGFEQYLAHIYVKSGDYCQLYDVANKVAWVKPLNSASVSAFSLQNDRYTCSTDGCYDFYIKIKYGSDELYIGPGTDCTSTPTDPSTPSTPQDYATAVPSECEDVMLQAFYWNSQDDSSYGTSKWTALKNNASEINAYFDLVWLPPSCNSNDKMGYLPKQYSNQVSKMGMKAELNQLIKALHEGGTKVLADVVINHAANRSSWVDFMEQDFGTYGKFQPMNTWITSNDEAKNNGYTVGANPDDGQESNANYPSARDWDHKNVNVQNMCKAYLKFLKYTMNYDGFRFDYCGGYHVSHVNDYVSEAKPYFSVMEYWNGDASVLKSRIDNANKNTLTFDFATFYTAFQNGIAKSNYGNLKSCGLRGRNYSKYAVTFVDNHDTFNRSDIGNTDCGNSSNGSTSLNNRDLMLQCNAYILSMPGVPCVFWPHWYKYKSEIKAMIHARKSAGIHSESTVEESSGSGWYKATIHGKAGNVILYLGSAASEAAPSGYKQAIKESKVAMYYTGDETRDIENVQAAPKSEKFMQDGKLYIRCGERVYDAQGRIIH